MEPETALTASYLTAIITCLPHVYLSTTPSCKRPTVSDEHQSKSFNIRYGEEVAFTEGEAIFHSEQGANIDKYDDVTVAGQTSSPKANSNHQWQSFINIDDIAPSYQGDQADRTPADKLDLQTSRSTLMTRVSNPQERRSLQIVDAQSAQQALKPLCQQKHN
ncbi:hypothetical protein RRG08_031253 [Elysia crispata]|uniref:Uncharacterized protein n=1 Tax=Elysia crispata TaxID=231223 RepID=A0AAE1DZM5_9GAST|nr:hypothetical protein RRG08_031253 [Elysia crispata]